MDANASTCIKMLRRPLRYRLYLLTRLPAAFFSGLRIRHLTGDRCEVSVPYRWFTRNPFHSTYFACLAMAAEMSTGVLCLVHIYKRTPGVSMLVVREESQYMKKAVRSTRFCCEDGLAIRQAIEEACVSGAGVTVQARSTGRNPAGEVVAEFVITWSLKAKK